MANKRKSRRKSKSKKRKNPKRVKAGKKAARSRKRKANKRKSNKKGSSKKRVAGRRGSKKSFIDKIPILKNKTVQKIGFGIGMGAVAVQIIDLIPIPQVQQNKRIIQLGVEAATEPLAAVADIALNSGVLQNTARGIGLGNGNSGNTAVQGNMGFA